MQYLKKLQYNSPVILTYTIICIFVLILDFLTNGYTTNKLFSVYRSSLTDFFSYVRVFTHILGHMSFEHFFNNFLIILIVGPMLEEKYGSRNMLILILLTSFIIGVAQVIFSASGLLGASGIAFMLIVLASFTNIQEGKIPITMLLVVFMYLGKEIYYGIVLKDNVSQFTHIIGGICGIFWGIALNKALGKNRFIRKGRYLW